MMLVNNNISELSNMLSKRFSTTTLSWILAIKRLNKIGYVIVKSEELEKLRAGSTCNQEYKIEMFNKIPDLKKEEMEWITGR